LKQATRRETTMKKLIGLALLLSACHRSANPNPPLPAGTQVGAATPAAAVATFLAAVKEGDLQAISTVWGDEEGTVRDRLDRTALEQREYYMARCARHDKYLVVSEATGQQGSRVLAVQLTRGPLTRSTNFEVVKGPQNRWYVKNFDLKSVDDICTAR
jgi:hypothetical protein